MQSTKKQLLKLTEPHESQAHDRDTIPSPRTHSIFYHWQTILIGALLYASICHTLFHRTALFPTEPFRLYLESTITTSIACLMFYFAYRWLRCVLMGLWMRHPLHTIWSQSSKLAEQFASWPYLRRFILLNGIITSLTYGTDHLKALIPYFHPFQHDLALINVDKALLLGHTSWYWIKALRIDDPHIVHALDNLYISWFFVVPYVLIINIMTCTPQHAKKILLAYISTWIILGIGLATLLASVGPCFLDLVNVASSHFAEQMLTLQAIHHAHPLIAIDEQIILRHIWHHFADGHHIGGSISACPSLHVGCAALVYKICATHHPKYKWLAVLYLGLIWLGSVVLGWHYFCDGLFAILGVHWLWQTWTPWLIRMQKCD